MEHPLPARCYARHWGSAGEQNGQVHDLMGLHYIAPGKTDISSKYTKKPHCYTSQGMLMIWSFFLTEIRSHWKVSSKGNYILRSFWLPCTIPRLGPEYGKNKYRLSLCRVQRGSHKEATGGHICYHVLRQGRKCCGNPMGEQLINASGMKVLRNDAYLGGGKETSYTEDTK